MDYGKFSPGKITKQIKLWEKEIIALREIVKNSFEDKKVECENKILNIKSKIDEANAKVEELKKKGKDILGNFDKN